MSLKEKINDIRNAVVIDMSKVSCDHVDFEEKKAREELNAKYNSNDPDRASETSGLTDDITVREVSNGKDKYVVKDLLYSYNFTGRVHCWQYGERTEDKNVEVREFYVTEDSHTLGFVMKKENGKYQEVEGDVNKVSTSGLVSRTEAKFGGKNVLIPQDLDLSDNNAIRYHFKYDEEIAHFIDKFVIVTPEERKAYKEYAAEMDKRERDDLKVQKASERDQKRAQKDADKQARKKEKDKAAQVAAAERVKQKFFGRK